jgi:beta-1,4-N-acetylglucosaminyltransferase
MTFKTVAFLGSGGHTTEMIQLLQQLDHTVYTPIVYFVSKSDVTSIPRLQRYILSSDGGAVKGGDRGSSWHRWEGRCPDDTSANKQMKLMDNGATITSTSDNNNSNSNNNNNKLKTNNAQVYFLPRAREVHQSYISSIFTTIYSAYETIQLLWKIQPNLIVTNGPGTCVPIIYCAFILRCLFSLVDMDRRSSSSSKNILFRTIFVESLCRVKTLSLSGKLVYPIVDSFVVHWPSLMERYGMVEICDVFVPSLDS